MIFKNRKAGFALSEVLIVVVIVGLIAVLAIPGFSKVRSRAQENAIRRNLALIIDMGQQCILENGLKDPVPLADFTGIYCPEMRSVAGESYDDLVIHPEGGTVQVAVGSRVVEYSY